MLEIKDTTNTTVSASHLCLHLEIYPKYTRYSDCVLTTKHYDKRCDFDFIVVNFPLTCSNIPAAPEKTKIQEPNFTVRISLFLSDHGYGSFVVIPIPVQNLSPDM